MTFNQCPIITISKRQTGFFIRMCRTKCLRLSKLEKGTLTPNLPELIKMSEIFGVSTDYLLCISDSRDNKKEFTTGDLFRNLFELEEKILE